MTIEEEYKYDKTLDDAIAYCEDMAKKNEGFAGEDSIFTRYAKTYRQFAEWFRELKAWREKDGSTDKR